MVGATHDEIRILNHDFLQRCDQHQKAMAVARATADRKFAASFSYRVATRRKSLRRQKSFPMRWRPTSHCLSKWMARFRLRRPGMTGMAPASRAMRRRRPITSVSAWTLVVQPPLPAGSSAGAGRAARLGYVISSRRGSSAGGARLPPGGGQRLRRPTVETANGWDGQRVERHAEEGVAAASAIAAVERHSCCRSPPAPE